MVLRLSSLANRPSATLLLRSLTFIVMLSMFISNCRPTGIDNAHDTTVRLHEKVDGRVVVICGPTRVCIHFISIWFSVRSWTMQQPTFFIYFPLKEVRHCHIRQGHTSTFDPSISCHWHWRIVHPLNLVQVRKYPFPWFFLVPLCQVRHLHATHHSITALQSAVSPAWTFWSSIVWCFCWCERAAISVSACILRFSASIMLLHFTLSTTTRIMQ